MDTYLAFGARPDSLGCSSELIAHCAGKTSKKHFLSMSNSFPAPHISRHGPLNPINFSANPFHRVTDTFHRLDSPTVFCGLWVSSCGCGMRGIVTAVYLDESNTEVHRKKSHHLFNGTEGATRASNQKIRPLKTLVAAGTSRRSFIEELDQPGLSHARGCNSDTVARLNHLQMLIALCTALTADKNEALITLFKALTAASHAGRSTCAHDVAGVFFLSEYFKRKRSGERASCCFNAETSILSACNCQRTRICPSVRKSHEVRSKEAKETSLINHWCFSSRTSDTGSLIKS